MIKTANWNVSIFDFVFRLINCLQLHFPWWTATETASSPEQSWRPWPSPPTDRWVTCSYLLIATPKSLWTVSHCMQLHLFFDITRHFPQGYYNYIIATIQRIHAAAYSSCTKLRIVGGWSAHTAYTLPQTQAERKVDYAGQWELVYGPTFDAGHPSRSRRSHAFVRKRAKNKRLRGASGFQTNKVRED